MNRKEIAADFAKSINSSEIDKIILYGSVARGDDNTWSDIDILIISNYEDNISDKIYDKVVDVILNLQERISINIISNAEFKADFNPYIINIKKEGIALG